MEEWQGKKGGKKDKKEKRKGMGVEDKKRGKKEGKKKKEILSQYFYNSFTINFKR